MPTENFILKISPGFISRLMTDRRQLQAAEPDNPLPDSPESTDEKKSSGAVSSEEQTPGNSSNG